MTKKSLLVLARGEEDLARLDVAHASELAEPRPLLFRQARKGAVALRGLRMTGSGRSALAHPPLGDAGTAFIAREPPRRRE